MPKNKYRPGAFRYKLLALGLVLRIVFFIYSIFQDSTPLKFTDIDYSVFSDAALLVFKGHSPYDRPTYRYTPLLAFLNIPNHFLFSSFGKWVFGICDLVAGIFMTRLAEKSNGDVQHWILGIWVLNPFVAVISMRGSAESVVCFLILATLEAVRTKTKLLASILFGLSVHFKIFPIIYALPIWFNIPYKNGKFKSNYFWSWNRISFGFISAAVFLGLTGVFYWIYGYKFLYETYLYHITRRDHRHNFSLYFYPIYLSSANEAHHSVAKWLLGPLGSFFPQLGLVAFLGWMLSNKLFLACFAQTFAFVMLNKVVTSQYFMWYLFFLPIILPSNSLLRSKWKIGVLLLLLWGFSQGLWLFFAYQLEFNGFSTFRYLWFSSCIFLMVNALLLRQIILNHE